MCWLDGLANPVRQVALAALVFLCVLAVGSAAAQDHIPRGQPIPQSIRWVNATATGANTRASASWTYGGTTSHHSFPVPVGKASIGGAAKAALRRGLPAVGWALALRDLINGAGWAIDELQKQVVDPGYDAEPLGEVAWCITFTGDFPVSGRRCTSSKSDVGAMFGRVTGFEVSHQEDITSGSGRVYFYRPGLTYTNNISFSRVAGAVWQPSDNANPSESTTEISNVDLGELLKNHPDIVNAVLIDPDTGAPIRIPELVDALNDLRRSLEEANGITTPGTDLVAPDDLATPTPSESSWPGFCEWASVVCEFITWFKTDPDNGEHPELPYEEREVEMVPYNSGLGGGSCPSSTMVPVLDGEVEISWVGICGFVTYLRPLLIACAWILSAFIVVNARPGRL